MKLDRAVISICSVLYGRRDQAVLQRLGAAAASLDRCGLRGELIIIDNSSTPSTEVEAWRLGWRGAYHWCAGYNVYLSGAWQLALDQYVRGDVFVYVCPAHGETRDPRWIADLNEALADPAVGAAGDIRPCNYASVAAVPADCRGPQIHVQGGCAGYRVDAIRAIGGFSHRFPFEFSDVDVSRRLVQAGYQLRQVPSICSVAAGRIPDRDRPRFAYIHDYA